MKTKKDQFAEGCIGEAYGRETFLKVVPAPSIDKVKFTIVKMKSNGKDHIDFYLDIDEMRKFSDDVLSGTAAKKFAADMNEQYPKAYQFTTGENGCKHLNIGGGQKGIRFNIKTPDGSKNAIVPWEVLKTICYDFRVIVGLVPVTQGTYYHSLIAAFYKGEATRANAISSYNAKQDGTYVGDGNEEPEQKAPANGTNAKQQAPKPEASAPKPVQQSQKPAAPANKAPEQKPNQAAANNAPAKQQPKPIKITVKVKNPIADMKSGGKAFQVWNQANETLNVIITKERLDKGGLDDMLAAAASCGTKMSIDGWISGDRILIA